MSRLNLARQVSVASEKLVSLNPPSPQLKRKHVFVSDRSQSPTHKLLKSYIKNYLISAVINKILHDYETIIILIFITKLKIT